MVGTSTRLVTDEVVTIATVAHRADPISTKQHLRIIHQEEVKE